MDDETAVSTAFTEASRERAVDLVCRGLAAAWGSARTAGAEPADLFDLLRGRLAALASAPTAYAPARAESVGVVTTVIPPPLESCRRRPRRVQDLAMTAGEFIGREVELARFSHLLEEVFARRPGTVFLAGDAGVGKTRLLGEFAAQALVDDRAFVLRGKCVDLSEDARIPYGPLVWALREFVMEHGAEARALAGPGWNGLGGLIAEFVDEPAKPVYTGSQTTPGAVYGSVQRVLRYLGDRRPVVLIFEDVQWADRSTLDLVSYLTRSRRDERVLLICSHRTVLAQGDALAARLADLNLSGAAETMDLRPFTEDELRRLLNSDPGVEVGREQIRLAHRLSDGNALFARELLTTGALADPDLISVPTSLQSLMNRQVVGLSPAALKLLSIAATAARRVSYRLLAAVGDMGRDEVESALRECLEQRILVRDTPYPGYVFRHALLRETVYANEIPEILAERHAAMAEAITADTALSLEEDASSAVELAHHWFRAGRAPEALVASLRAAAMTARLSAFPEAETHYRHALDLWKRVADPQELTGVTRERVLSEAADAARWSAHVPQAVEYIREAIREIDVAVEPRRAGELHERLGSYLWEAGDGEASAKAYADAQRFLAQAGSADATDVLVLAGLAGANTRAGRHSDALRLAMEAAELAGNVGAAIERGRALNAAGVACAMLGRAEEGVALLRESLEIARSAEQLEDLFRAYANLGFALERAGDLPAAVDVALEGRNRARELGVDFARLAGLLANNAAVALEQLGEWDRAVDLLDEALLDKPPVRQSAYLRLSRAEIAVARGDFDVVDRLLAEIADERLTDPRFIGALRACEAELALWREQPDAALASVFGGLEAVDGGENAAEEHRLCALGLRAAADLRHLKSTRETVAARADGLMARAERCGARDASPDAPALRGQCAAEYARHSGTDRAEAWEAVARDWEGLSRPYRAAYARWRQANALRARKAGEEAAAKITREALESLGKLGTRPLQSALAGAADLPSADPLSVPLTKRQIEVAVLVAQDLSNASIAKALGVEAVTVGRHIHDAMRVLRKHGYPVTGRTGLANYVREQGLLGAGPVGGSGPSDPG